MRSGLAAFDEDPDSPGNEDKMDEAADPIAFTLATPRAWARVDVSAVDPYADRYGSPDIESAELALRMALPMLSVISFCEARHGK